MKILYIGMKYAYYGSSSNRVGFSFEHNNFYDTLLKMDNAKHEVIYFPYDEVLAQKGKQDMNKELLRLVDQEKPDLCFFVLYTEEFYPETIKKITENSGAATFNWFTDDHWRFDGYSQHWASLFHWVGTTDSKAPEKYKKIGYKNVIKTQWACNHFLYEPQINADANVDSRRYDYDLSFVGQPHGDRQKIVSKMKHSDINVECFGSGWENGRVEQGKMIEIFSQSKINLNLSNAQHGFNIVSLGHVFFKRISVAEGVSGQRDLMSYFKLFLSSGLAFQKPKDVFQNLKNLVYGRREQIKGRNFEIPGCGGFLLTGKADNLQDYYIDGKEIVIFENTGDLIEKARYYLQHDEEREAIAQAGHERTLRDHTYEKRFNEIFEIMGLDTTNAK